MVIVLKQKQRHKPMRYKENKNNHREWLNINGAPFQHHFDEDTAY